MKPITPKEALRQKVVAIPDCVIETINKLIIKEIGLEKPYFTLKLSEVRKEIEKSLSDNNLKWDNCYIDFESIYEKAGWDVEYSDGDSDGYYKFSKK